MAHYRFRSLSNLVLLIAIMLVAAVVFLGWYLFHQPPRPMFATTFEAEHGFFPSWHKIRPILDRSGNIGYPDLELNMLVVIVTDDPSYDLYTIPDGTTPTEATLLRGSRYEVSVVATRDRLIIVEPAKGRREEFIIAPSATSSWYSQLYRLDAQSGSNLLDEILKRYHGSDRARLEGFLSKIRS